MKKITLLLATMMAFTIVNAQEKTSINVEELQKVITKHISKNFVGYKPIEAYKIVSKGGVTTYEVIVEKAPNKLDLYYEKNGKFMRKEVEKKTPVTKTTPNKTKVTPNKTKPTPKNTNNSNIIKQDTLEKQ